MIAAGPELGTTASQPGARRWPAVTAVAFAAVLLYALPLVVGRASTPEGWRFTWNYNASPDVMQYRVWEHETQRTGLLISNTLTSEPNPPRLLVLTYYLIGRIASAGGWNPDAVAVGVGAVSAFALTVLLFVCIRTFTTSSRQTWWVFFVVLLGGGLGGHIKLVSSAASAAGLPWIQDAINQALQRWLLWEEYRGHYVFNTLFDTHFLVVWLLTTSSILALYHAIREFSAPRIALASALCALTTFVHVYEGVTLVAIATAIAVACWRKGTAVRSAFLSAAACSVAVLIATMVLAILYRQSGLPVPAWRAVNILLSIVVIAYPVAWLIIVPGLRDYWASARLHDVFLVGWAAGCLFVLFSGPFYAYPDRGAITLQIPLYVMAGAIYFRQHTRPRWQHVVVLVLLLGATPLWILKHRLEMARTVQNAPYAFLTPDHQAILAALNDRAQPGDVMLEHERDVLWLAPGFRGSTYCGHFFLTVDFERKRAETERFFAESDRAWQSQFLRDHLIRFVFVPADGRPAQLAAVPGLRPVISNRVGDLFEFDRQ